MKDINTNAIKIYIGTVICMIISGISILLLERYNILYEKHIIDFYNLSEDYIVMPFSGKLGLILSLILLIGGSVANLRTARSVFVYIVSIVAFFLLQWNMIIFLNMYIPAIELVT